MLDTILSIICALAFASFAAKRLLTYLHYFQQEEYDAPRFIKWMFTHRVIDKNLSLPLLGIGILSIVAPLWICLLLMTAAFIGISALEKDPRLAGKKPLVLTQRARRILLPALLIALIAGFLNASPFYYLALAQIVPFLLLLTNLCLTPFEKRTQQKFYAQAKTKLVECNPTIIAITGSFGKTSIKHILGHILKTQAPTLITPGSINTVMGITRIIREQLGPNHKYFIVEMGAYGEGSIQKLCALTPPDHGIISAIGHAHYERFKTLESVAHAKFELAQAVLKKNGQVIVHEDTLRFEHAKTMQQAHSKNFTIVGAQMIQSIAQNAKGLTVVVKWRGKDYTLNAPLYGLHHGTNIALAFAMAATLGIPENDIVTALASTPQIAHRLEVKPQNDATTIIDDAYNSNPQGFASALELLKTLKPANGRAILVTPGMVELGAAHDAEHEKIGMQAAHICDIVLLVNADRIPTFSKAYKTAGGKELIKFSNFSQAQNWLNKNKTAGDVILLENDLPDLYERRPRI